MHEVLAPATCGATRSRHASSAFYKGDVGLTNTAFESLNRSDSDRRAHRDYVKSRGIDLTCSMPVAATPGLRHIADEADKVCVDELMLVV
jgi:hypothetical protein